MGNFAYHDEAYRGYVLVGDVALQTGTSWAITAK